MSLFGNVLRTGLNLVTQNPWTNKIVGNATDLVGTTLGLPEMHISESIAGGNTLNTNKVASAAPTATVTQSGQVLGAQAPVDETWMLPANDPKKIVNQITTSTNNATNNTVATAAPDTTASAPAAPTNEELLSQLQAPYETAKNNLIGQLSGLNTDYNNEVKYRQGIHDSTKQDYDTQGEAINKQFGDILNSQLQTYKDLGRQRQGMFAGLGTLESSAFGEQQARADQDLADHYLQTGLEKQKTVKDLNKQWNDYSREYDKQMGDLASEYDKSKLAINNAMSQGNFQEAQALKDYIATLEQQYGQLQQYKQQNLIQAAGLQAQGANVSGLLKQINGDPYATQVANQLAGLKSGFGGILTQLLNNQPQQVAFTGKSGKKYNSYQEALSAGDA